MGRAFRPCRAFSPSGSEVCAQQQDNILKQAFKIFGFATDVPPPAGFVAKTRPAGDLDYIPVFQPPPEPARPLMKSDQLKAMKSDLNSVEQARRRASASLSAGRQGAGGRARGEKEAEAERRPRQQ